MSASTFLFRYRTALITAALMTISAAGAQAQTFNSNWWTTSFGPVLSMVPSADGSVIFMGGSFNYVGPVLTYGASLDMEQGQPLIDAPMPNSRMECAVADGNGGWFVGGAFSAVGGQTRQGIARINADGSLSSWQAETDGVVYSLHRDGSTLYLSGAFAMVSGQPRSGLAAVDVITGEVLPFSATPSIYPSTLCVVGPNLIIGGEFQTVNGTARANLAAVDKLTGALQSWNPSPNSEVHCMALSEDASTLFVGGSFVNIANVSRARTAAFSTADLSLLPWTVSVSSGGIVRAMSVADGVVVLGGEFETLDGLPRQNLGAVDEATSDPLAWSVDADNAVLALMLHDGVVYAGGEFRKLGGVVRRYVGAMDLAMAEVTAWDPVAGQEVLTLALSGDRIYAGGRFTSIGGKVRNKLMAIDVATGRPTAWDPDAANDYGAVNNLQMSPDGQVLYCSGNFIDTIGGQPRRHLVALNTTTGSAYPWAPQPSGSVGNIELSPDGTVLYASGGFTTVGGVPRSRLAAFNADPQQTQLLPWDPGCTDAVISDIEISSDGSTLFVSGDFTAAADIIGGQPRDRLAALSTLVATNNATSWTVPVTGTPTVTTVHALLLDPVTDVLYFGGTFSAQGGNTVAGASRDNLAAVSATTGAVLPWNPGANDAIYDLAWSPSGQILVSGAFEGPAAIGGAERQYVAHLDPTTGTVGPFSATFNTQTSCWNAIQINAVLVAGGSFSFVHGQQRTGLAGFDGGPVGVADVPERDRLALSPNPTSGELHLPALPEARWIELHDATGRSVLRTAYAPHISLAALPAALYMVVVRDVSGKEIGRERVVLQR